MEKLMPLGELFNKTFDEYRSKFKIFTKISSLNLISLAVVFVLGSIFAGVTILAGLYPWRDIIFNPVSVITFIFLALIGFLASLACIFIGITVFSATFYVIKDGKNESSVYEIIKTGWKNAWSLVWINILSGLAVLAGFFLLFFPAVLFGVWFSMSSYFFVFEGIKGSEALKKSKALCKGYFWPLFLRLFLIVLAGWLISSIKIAGPIINMLFVTPFSVLYSYMIYKDLKRVNK